MKEKEKAKERDDEIVSLTLLKYPTENIVKRNYRTGFPRT
jgi:hypothetical protein